MSELINVLSQDGNLVVSSREVASNFEKEHNDTKKRIRELEKDMGEISHNYFIKEEYKDTMNRTQEEYLLTRDGFSLLVMGFTGQKALQWKLKYIEAFNKMEQHIKEQRQPKLDSRFLYQIAEQLEEKEKQITEMKPKALFADAVSASHTSILVGDLAKIIKQNGYDIGANRLFEWMRNNGFLIKRKGADWNMPTQYSMTLELFEVKESTSLNPDGSVRINKTTKVTGKGQQYFINKFLNKEQEGQA